MPKLDNAEAHENQQLMQGAVECEPALGRGPAPDGHTHATSTTTGSATQFDCLPRHS
jgi:hypothetical protein